MIVKQGFTEGGGRAVNIIFSYCEFFSSLKYRRLWNPEGLYNLYIDNKGADQLICAFVFAYAKIRFSPDAIQFYDMYSHSMF